MGMEMEMGTEAKWMSDQVRWEKMRVRMMEMIWPGVEVERERGWMGMGIGRSMSLWWRRRGGEAGGWIGANEADQRMAERALLS